MVDFYFFKNRDRHVVKVATEIKKLWARVGEGDKELFFLVTKNEQYVTLIWRRPGSDVVEPVPNLLCSSLHFKQIENDDPVLRTRPLDDMAGDFRDAGVGQAWRLDKEIGLMPAESCNVETALMRCV